MCSDFDPLNGLIRIIIRLIYIYRFFGSFENNQMFNFQEYDSILVAR